MVEAAQKKVPPRPPPVEAKPIIGGRMWIPIVGLILLGLMANPNVKNWVSVRFAPKEPYSNVRAWKVGAETDLRVTLVTADFERLDCSFGETFDGAHCGYDENQRPWPKGEGEPAMDNNPNVIQPYRTSPENHLILLAGLWAEPAVAMRLHQEPPGSAPVKRLNRFDAKCRVKFIGEMKDFKLRWERTSSWAKEARALVARPVSCSVVR